MRNISQHTAVSAMIRLLELADEHDALVARHMELDKQHEAALDRHSRDAAKIRALEHETQELGEARDVAHRRVAELERELDETAAQSADRQRQIEGLVDEIHVALAKLEEAEAAVKRGELEREVLRKHAADATELRNEMIDRIKAVEAKLVETTSRAAEDMARMVDERTRLRLDLDRERERAERAEHARDRARCSRDDLREQLDKSTRERETLCRQAAEAIEQRDKAIERARLIESQIEAEQADAMATFERSADIADEMADAAAEQVDDNIAPESAREWKIRAIAFSEAAKLLRASETTAAAQQRAERLK